MVDNFDKIRELLDFSIEGTFYYLQILRRKKENPKAKSAKVIKNTYIKNMDYFDSRKESIIEMCDYFNARAYLRLNRRSFKEVAFKALEEQAKLMRNGQFEPVSRIYSKACGRTNCEPNRIWLIDLDGEEVKKKKLVWALIEKLQQDIQDDYKPIAEIPTKNGLHIITNPFNVKSFKYTYPDITIHKDNPTLLYTP